MSIIGDKTVYCHQCKRETLWNPIYNGSKRVRCEGCGDLFPCRQACEHIDCREERSAWRSRRTG